MSLFLDIHQTLKTFSGLAEYRSEKNIGQVQMQFYIITIIIIDTHVLSLG